MAMKKSIRTRKDVPKRSVLHNRPIDYAPNSKRLESELEKILTVSSGGRIPAGDVQQTDMSKVLKSFK